ncbi:alpha/beta hydrolase [Psychroserpens sp. XS_ASV72]|uniref:alpha/beta hydrolase n=1 Tax=Psychroserpens sp. XS_ASV72 TaxID=3241293 RepID=UPI003514D6D6
MKGLFISLTLFVTFTFNAQEHEFISKPVAITSLIDGTLMTPTDTEELPLAIIISDAGLTDRNGNQNFQKNNILKKLAEGLAQNNIASFRYDKRTIKQIRRSSVDQDISFDDFVLDAISVVNYFKEHHSFSKVIIIGHGQGSLIGMLASNSGVDSYISLAGSGKPIDQVILDQVAQMDSSLVKGAESAFKELKSGNIAKNYPQALGSVFSLDIQPFMRSWMKYHPEQKIKELDIPILIVSGTKDLQVPVSEAQMLHENAKNSTLEIIENMNHVLFIIEGKTLENSKSYNESFRPISKTLLHIVSSFINN